MATKLEMTYTNEEVPLDRMCGTRDYMSPQMFKKKYLERIALCCNWERLTAVRKSLTVTLWTFQINGLLMSFVTIDYYPHNVTSSVYIYHIQL
ncbi:hypothetical protein OSTOST_24231 [Ostertagia ostertagi]